jgi:hypothetical protein
MTSDVEGTNALKQQQQTPLNTMDFSVKKYQITPTLESNLSTFPFLSQFMTLGFPTSRDHLFNFSRFPLE